MSQTLTTRQEYSARFAELYSQLNPEQQQAVDAIEGVVMVLAGPGTGKTQLLAMRIANILQRTHMDPWNILCLTFTESGVVAMRERLLSIMGEAAYYVRIHTFHSFCNEIIQEHPDVFARARDWQPLSEVERVQLLESLLQELPGTSPLKPFGSPYLYVRDIGGNLQALKQENISPAQLLGLLDSIEQYLTATEQVVETFCQLKPSERSEARCEELKTALLAASVTVQLPVSLQDRLRSWFSLYEEKMVEAVTARAASSARTALKNDIKRWFLRMRRDLPKHKDLQQMYAQYQTALVEQGRYDYEDMIAQVISAWETRDALLAQYQERFQYVLVDEYQDTNGAQNNIVRLLGSFDEQPNVFVVGDDKQSIYRFQGASLTNMLEFYERYKDSVQVISLRDNYRSQPTILAAAGAVIEHNQETISKYIPGVTAELTARASYPSVPLEHHVFPSEAAEDAWVAERIAELIAGGVSPEEIAVIFRYHRDGEGILAAVRAQGVPVRLEAGEDALKDRFVQQLITLLAFIEEPDRDERVAAILHFDWLGFDSLEVIQVVHYASRQRLPILTVMQEAEHLEAAGVRGTEPWQAFVGRLGQWRALLHNATLQHFLQTVMQESGLLEYVVDQHECVAVLQHLTRMLEEAKQMNAANHNLSVSAFLAGLQLLQDHGLALTTRPWQVADQAVRLMTAHKAKGLEFSHVFVIRLVDKVWGNNPEPNRLALPAGLVRYDFVAAERNNEDERRLFYVAMTRARQALVLTQAYHTAAGRPTVPSIFANEIPLSWRTYVEQREEQAQEEKRLLRQLRPLPGASHQELQGWLKKQLQQHVLSVTHVNNYLACPRRFYIRNVLRMPQARTPYQALGTAVHEALDQRLRQYRQTHQAGSLEHVVGEFERSLGREILTKSEARDLSDVGSTLLRQYCAYYPLPHWSLVHGEYDFSSHGVVVDGIPLTGKIDKLQAEAERGEIADPWPTGTPVTVVDFKTGQPDGKRAALVSGGEYHRQLVFYKLLCDSSPQFTYQMVKGEIDFVQPNRRGQFIKKSIEITEEDLIRLREELKTVWREIQELRFLDPKAGCGSCEYCEYQPLL